MADSEPTRTVWTKSIYDGLYLGMEKNNRKAVLVALADLKSRDIAMPQIMKQVREDKGAKGEAELKRLMSDTGGAGDAKKGLFSRVRDLFR